MKLFALNLLSSIGLILTFTQVHKILGFLVLVTALILNIKKLFERPKK